MIYFHSIQTSFLVFPFLALFFTIPFFLHEYHKYGSVSFLRILILYSFILYLLTAYFLVILPLPKKEEVEWMPNMVRLIPFGFVQDIFRETSFVLTDSSTYFKSLTDPCFYTVLFNLFLTVPFGMYLRYYFRFDFKKTCFSSFAFSLFFELTQLTGLYFIYPYPYRVFDVDDLIVNTLGGMLGYIIMGWIHFLPTREEIDQRAREKGKVVTGFRRIFVFGLDLFFFVILSLFCSIFSQDYAFLIVFFLYYIVIPSFYGMTFAGKFLNVKLVFSKLKFLFLPLRILFLFFSYLFLPWIFLLLVTKILSYFPISIFLSFSFFIGVGFVFVLFYLVSFFLLLRNKEMFYDKWFFVSYESTIDEK